MGLNMVPKFVVIPLTNNMRLLSFDISHISSYVFVFMNDLLPVNHFALKKQKVRAINVRLHSQNRQGESDSMLERK